MKDKIKIEHGNGGKQSYKIIQEIIMPNFKNPILEQLDDAGVLEIGRKKIAFSTDGYVVSPIFFPGGDIGRLAVNGTVNDLSMVGAIPKYISLSLILEEGFSKDELEKILQSIKIQSKEAGVLVVCGDTKVVPKGMADKIFITTSGIGIIPHGVNISGCNAKVGDKIILSGTIADHGISILVVRDSLGIEADIKSDTAPLNKMVEEILKISNNIHTLRDPTRGGIASSLNEIARQSNVSIKIYEEKIPIKDEVKGICEILGFSPLYIANEGKMLVFVSPSDADKVLECMRQNKYGKYSQIIGEVVEEGKGLVFMETIIGNLILIDMPSFSQLPRIC